MLNCLQSFLFFSVFAQGYIVFFSAYTVQCDLGFFDLDFFFLFLVFMFLLDYAFPSSSKECTVPSVGNVTFAAKMLSLRDREYDQMRTFVRYRLWTIERVR